MHTAQTARRKSRPAVGKHLIGPKLQISAKYEAGAVEGGLFKIEGVGDKNTVTILCMKVSLDSNRVDKHNFPSGKVTTYPST